MNEAVLDAISKARWNESVTVDVESESRNTTSSSIVLVPRLDKENGGVTWEGFRTGGSEDGLFSEKDAGCIHLQTKKWIFPMLNDRRRNDLYERAIELASREVAKRFATIEKGNGNGDDDNNDASTGLDTIRTLDIGSGTGLLAMLSEKHLLRAIGGKSGGALPPKIRVTSLEMAGPMADIAKKTVHLERTSKLQNKNPKDNILSPSRPLIISSSAISDESTPKEDESLVADVIEGHSCKIPPMKKSMDQQKNDDMPSMSGNISSGSSTEDTNSEPSNTEPSSSKGQDNGALLCTSELLESGLLGEGWLPAMRDAWERHLHPKAVVVPQRARIMAKLVEGCSGFCGPHQSLSLGKDLPSLNLLTTASSGSGMLSDGSYDPITGRKHGIQVEIHADRYLSSGELKDLSDPIEALALDVTSPESLPSSGGTRLASATKFVAKQSGTAEGILFWWELDLYDDLTYSTSPGSDFQDHWHQCLYVFPSSSEEQIIIQVQKDKKYNLLTSHTDSRVHFEVTTDDATGKINNLPQKAKSKIPPQATPVAGPSRCRQLNDLARSAKFRDGISFALENLAITSTEDETKEWEEVEYAQAIKKESSLTAKAKANRKMTATLVAPAAAAASTATAANVLDISDFSLCGMMASLMGASMVTSIESSSSGLSLETAKVAQIGNVLSSENTDGIFQIVQCHAETLTENIVLPPDMKEEKKPNRKRKRLLMGMLEDEDETNHHRKGIINLVVGEPYYEMLEGWPIETALNFFYTLRMLKRKGIVKPKALCVPARAVVMACGIECPDLGQAYNRNLSSSPCKFNDSNDQKKTPRVCGFDHTPVTECWNFDQNGISIPLWEYNNVVPVTETVVVGILDYEGDSIIPGYWVDGDGETASTTTNSEVASISTSVLMAPFTKKNRTCHAIAFWVDYGIRNVLPSSKDGERSEDPSSSFETISTGFGASQSQPFSSRIPERQTVRILAKGQPTILGKSLAIPRHGLEL